MSVLKASVSDCVHCGLKDVTVYLRDGAPIGCSGCLWAFFRALDPEQRPWPMSLWDDLRSLLR